jgi:basic amino acid/polyamine antiporter, APA family
MQVSESDVSHSQHSAAPRTLTFLTLTLYGIGDILGAGIYALVGKITTVSGPYAWVSFLVAMFVACLTAFSFAELSSRYPENAGEAHYCMKAFNKPKLALLIGWIILVSGTVSLATVSRTFAEYLANMLEIDSIKPIVIFAFLGILTYINFRGMKESSFVNIICTSIEFSGLLIIIGLCIYSIFFSGQTNVASSTLSSDAEVYGILTIIQGAALAFFAFIGFEDMVNVAEEVKEPHKTLPKAILTALFVASGIYITIIVLATMVVPHKVLATSNAPLLEVVRFTAPSFPTSIFTFITLFAVTNTGLLNYVMGSRLIYGLAKQGHFPKWYGKLHPKTKTPHRAIGLILFAALVLALSGSVLYLASLTSTLLLFVFTTTNVSLIKVKLSDKSGEKAPFSTSIFVPILATASCICLLLLGSLSALLSALAISCFGLGVFYIYDFLSHKKLSD